LREGCESLDSITKSNSLRQGKKCFDSLGPFTETKHNFKEIFIATDTASVQLFFNIFATGIETFVILWDQLLNTCVVEVCLAPGIGTTV
jgi:hypothetical protein